MFPFGNEMIFFIRVLRWTVVILCTCMVMEDSISPSLQPSVYHELCSWGISVESSLSLTWGVEGKSTFFLCITVKVFYLSGHGLLCEPPTLVETYSVVADQNFVLAIFPSIPIEWFGLGGQAVSHRFRVIVNRGWQRVFFVIREGPFLRLYFLVIWLHSRELWIDF